MSSDTQQLGLLGEVPVTLTIGWTELFGGNAREMTEQQRRDRWAQWLRLDREDNEGEGGCYWQCTEGCYDEQGRRCVHLRGQAWCSNAELPAAINPVLTMKYSYIGMACMGAGFALEKDAES